MVKSDAKLTYNPPSNMRLGSGIMSISKLHAAGLIVGLALDGGANDNADFFSLMKAAVGLQRATNESAVSYPSYRDVIKMATLDGAKVLGLDKVTGSLKIGKSADLIIINPNVTNMAASSDEIALIALNAEPANVDLVIFSGRMLKQDGKIIFTSEPLEELVLENQKTVDRLKSRQTAR